LQRLHADIGALDNPVLSASCAADAPDVPCGTINLSQGASFKT
jgi:hypothetical protein